MAYKMGIRLSRATRVRSMTIMAMRFGTRSRNTPARGPRNNGGTVCKIPMIVIFRAEPVRL